MRQPVIACLLATLTFGCGGGSTPPNIPEFPPPNPLLATPTPDPTRAGSAEIGPAGGTVTATAADGATIELVIPADTVPFPTTVTVTPLAGIDGALPGSPVAGVIITPESLIFPMGATLRFAPPSGTFDSPPLALRFETPEPAAASARQGTASVGEVGLTVVVPVCEGGALKFMEVPVTHGTTVVLLGASSGTLQTLGERTPANVCLQMEHAFGRLVQAEFHTQPCGGGIESDVSLLLNDLYFAFVNPALVAATTDDSRFREAFELFTCWLGLVIHSNEDATRVLRGNINGGRSLLAEAADLYVSRVPERCDAHDIRAAFDALDIYTMLAVDLIDPSPGLPNLDLYKIAEMADDCLKFRIEGTATMGFSETDYGDLIQEGSMTMSFRSARLRVVLASSSIVNDGEGERTAFNFHLVKNPPLESQFPLPGGACEGATAINGVDFYIQRMEIGSLLDPDAMAFEVDISTDGPLFCMGPVGYNEPHLQQLINVTQYFFQHVRGPGQLGKTTLANWSTGGGGQVLAHTTETFGTSYGDEGSLFNGSETWEAELLHVTD